MQLITRTPAESLEKTYRLQSANREQIDRFKASYAKLLPLINEKESEENVKDHLMDFLKEVYYKDAHVVAPKGKTDFVIHLGKDATSQAGVLFEVKRPANKGEMVTRQNLNTKAFHELLLYYFQERERAKNSDLRHCVITNVYEWFIFDAALIDRLFYRNAHLTKEYKAWSTGQKVSKNNELFYNEIVKPFLSELPDEIPFTWFDIRDYQKNVLDADKVNDRNAGPKALLSLYKILSPTHLLKLPTATDSNRLNPQFYTELLHLIGLEEVKDGGKKVIRRKEASRRDEGSLLENTIVQLDTANKLYHLPDRAQYGATTDEQLFSVALELCITWVNRILFLKLLESQLVKYHGGNPAYAFLNQATVADFDELYKLFFRVLAKKPTERQASIQTKFGRVPYLNSSLFEITELEDATININSLEDSQTLPLLRNSVLRSSVAYKATEDLNTLSYMFAFLDAYDFASESREEIQEKNRTLINASVLGLIFEKINGYKDGSFYTPGFITEYMCRETIRKAVVQKFNDAKGWNCKDFADLEDKDLDRNEANALINEIRICDPAVGSGHFLVSALNELIAIKSDLTVLQDETGKRLKGYTVSILNDELVVEDEESEPFSYGLQTTTNKPTTERQRVQKSLFNEKQTIIENCLFGVDINPNSVKICRLRLWIELLKNAYYTDESGFTELETLPNIDINIKQGNSLLSKFSLTEDLSDVFRKQKFSLRMYKDAVAAYKNAPNKEAKSELQRFINDIKSQFRETVYNRDPRRAKLAKLRGERILLDSELSIFDTVKDPKLITFEKKRYDKLIEQVETEIADIENNTLYRGSFEWRFEFPEVLNQKGDFVGFDAIIGNPPYIRQEEISTFKPYLKTRYSQVFTGTADLYVYFYELSFQILNSNGVFCFITPNKWFRANYGSPLRNFMAQYQISRITDFGELPVFEEAATFPMIYEGVKAERTGTTIFTQVSQLEKLPNGNVYLNVGNTIITSGKELFSTAINGQDWKLSDSDLSQVLDKVVQKGITLGNYVKGEIYRGVLTGLNEAFVIDVDTRLKLIAEDAASVDLIKPLTVGDDVRKWGIRPGKEHFIIITPVGVNIEKYQAIFKHLQQWKNQLEKRSDKGKFWYELRSCDYYPKFDSPKILFPDIAKESRFAFDNKGTYANNTIYFIPLVDSFLLGLLNSKLLWLYYKNNFTALGDAEKGGRLRFFRQFVEKIPVANSTEIQRTNIEAIVNQILTSKAADPTADTSALEAEIDRLVYGLYGLTAAEIAIVEGR